MLNLIQRHGPGATLNRAKGLGLGKWRKKFQILSVKGTQVMTTRNADVNVNENLDVKSDLIHFDP